MKQNAVLHGYLFGVPDKNTAGSIDNVSLDTGARLEGQVKAHVVSVAGELIGNIENAKRVDLLETGVINGDVKAGSLTVAAGSRMRGQVEFGWDGEPARGSSTKGYGTGS